MNKKIIIATIATLFLMSCSEREWMTIISNEEDLKLYDYYVDEFGNEGIVVCIKSYTNSKAAFVLSADETVCEWGPGGFCVFEQEFSEDNVNYPRFSLIMARYVSLLGVERFPAFNWCLNKNNGTPLSSDSWMLPSHKEMTTLLKSVNLNELNNALLNIGGTPLRSELYWTATEDFPELVKMKDTESEYNPENWAICMTPSSKYYTQKHIWWTKSRKLGVRAIKYIQYESSYNFQL